MRQGILPVSTVRPVGCITTDQTGDTTSQYCQASWLYYHRSDRGYYQSVLSGQLVVLPQIRQGILPVSTVRPVGCITTDQTGDTTSRYCQARWLYYHRSDRGYYQSVLSGQLVVLPQIRQGILPVSTVRPVGCITTDQTGDTTSQYCQASWLYYHRSDRRYYQSVLSGQLVVLPQIRQEILPVGIVRPGGCITTDQTGDTTCRYCQAIWRY